MMQENISLKDYTTLQLGGEARYFFTCRDEGDIVRVVDFAEGKNLPIFPLGGGSNIVVSDPLSPVICIKMENKGMRIIEETSESVRIQTCAGENWDDFVRFAVSRGFAGVEALSAIPGTCGAAPIQNIGAYGAEVSQTIESVKIYHEEIKEFMVLSNTDCKFGYRNSIFKQELKGKCIVESLVLRLSKKIPEIPQYPLVEETVHILQSKFSEISALECIRTAICKIRSEKLPDPKKIANVGSFFKNVFVREKKYKELLTLFPDIPSFLTNETYKIPAGWLIEKVGYKGYVGEGVGVHDKHALVLINTSAHKTEQLLSLARMIQNAVKEKFDVNLEIEPEIIV